jgi:excisionase family DNA binding protein
MLMTAKEAAKYSGLGENFLRQKMDSHQIEYLQVGSHRLLSEEAIWDFYNRNKTSVICNMSGHIRIAQRSRTIA